MIETFFAAFLLGLLGAGHCIGMCGGIVAALSFAFAKEGRYPRWLLLLCYNGGRILSYAVLGGALSWLTSRLQTHTDWPVLRTLAGIMLILMGCYVAGWWRVLVRLERLGALLWSRLKPLTDALLPVNHPGQALLLGGLWGWLPCGLIYSALVFASAQPNAWSGAMVMAVFGLGTLPAMLVSGVVVGQLKSLLQRRVVRNTSGALLILFGFWTLLMTYQHSGHMHVHSASELHLQPTLPSGEHHNH